MWANIRRLARHAETPQADPLGFRILPNTPDGRD
jgi:hypothetical protein